MTIPALITAVDNFELIRDKIAAILTTEIASQQALATAAAEDPALWKVRIYSERSDIWETWLNDQSDLSPICNVWFAREDFKENASDNIRKQEGVARYNLDCFGCGISEDIPGGGFTPGDSQAAFTAHRALRLVRKILMAGEYAYLGLRGSVWRRWPVSLESFQPELDQQTAINIVGVRFVLAVDMPEISPQVVAGTLEEISFTTKRAEDGEIIAQQEFDFTP